MRQAQADAFAAAQDLTRVRNEITALDLQKQGNVVRLEKLSAEKIQLEEERTRLDARLHEFVADVAAKKLNAQTQRGTVEQRQERLQAIHQELESSARQQDQALEQQAGTRSRLNVLEQLEAAHEGFSAGPLTALKQSQHVLGSLADRIRVPDQFVTAIETALGHHLQLVLTEQPESAHQILADLNASKAGRASVAPLAFLGNGQSSAVPGGNGQDHDPMTDSAAQAAPAASTVELNGVPLPAMAIVESETSIRPLVSRLLGMTRIVRDLDAATAAWRETSGAFHYVTLGGEMLSRHGIYTGGYHNGNGDGKAPASILGRKNQIADLNADAGQAERAGGGNQPFQRDSSKRADRAAGGFAAGADRTARPGGGDCYSRRRVQCAAEFPAPAPPEDRYGRLRDSKPGRAGTGRAAEARRAGGSGRGM